MTRAGFTAARWTTALVAPLVVTVIAVTLRVTGVAITDIALFVGYELIYVLLPGCMLCLLLGRLSGGWPSVVAVGWPMGYALEMAAYTLTAAAHAREGFAFMPLVATLVLGPLVLRRYGLHWITATTGRRARRNPGGATQGRAQRSELVALSGAITAAFVLLALTFFAAYPLPGLARSVVYYVDNVWDISIAAEARHHWPITEPYLAGHSLLHYYYGVFVHMAAINQVTGVALSSTVLRLLPTATIAIVALQLWALGRSLARSNWVGPIAVVLLLVAEDLNVDPTRPGASGVELFAVIPLSPTFAFGMIFFLGLLLAVERRLSVEGSPASSPSHTGAGVAPSAAGWLAMVSILALGASIVKTVAAVAFIGGLTLFWLWRVFIGQAPRVWGYCLALSTICGGAVYVLVLRGGLGSTLRLGIFAFIKYTNFGQLLHVRSALGIVPLVGAVLVSSLFAFAPLLGICWLVRRHEAISQFVVFCIAVFAAALAAYLTVRAPSDSQVYILYFGYLALVPAAAYGLALLWSDMPPDVRRKLTAACGAVLTVGLLIAASTLALEDAQGLRWLAWYALAYGLLAAAVVVASLRLQRALSPLGSSRRARLLACCIPMLVVLGLVKPLAVAVPSAWNVLTRARISSADSPAARGMTAALYSGLSWVREHTTPCDVLAVNNHLARAGAGPAYASYYYYSAFTERRVFLESWNFTPASTKGGQPFRARLALNERATLHGDPAALQEAVSTGNRLRTDRQAARRGRARARERQQARLRQQRARRLPSRCTRSRPAQPQAMRLRIVNRPACSDRGLRCCVYPRVSLTCLSPMPRGPRSARVLSLAPRTLTVRAPNSRACLTQVRHGTKRTACWRRARSRSTTCAARPWTTRSQMR